MPRAGAAAVTVAQEGTGPASGRWRRARPCAWSRAGQQQETVGQREQETAARREQGGAAAGAAQRGSPDPFWSSRSAAGKQENRQAYLSIKNDYNNRCSVRDPIIKEF